jgi:hypothetical protein
MTRETFTRSTMRIAPITIQISGKLWTDFGESRRRGLMPLNYVVRSQVIDPGAPVPPILLPVDGYLFLDKAKFPASFATDVDAEKAAFMADSQVPWRAPAR